MINREAIYAALFAMVSPLDGLVTVSRRLKHWSDVPASETPALFMAQGKQQADRPAVNGLPTRYFLDATIYLYVNTVDQIPGAVINPIVDAVTQIFDPTGIGTPQTLGGLVEWARVEGAIETSEGALGDVEVCMIPIRMLAV